MKRPKKVHLTYFCTFFQNRFCYHNIKKRQTIDIVFINHNYITYNILYITVFSHKSNKKNGKVRKKFTDHTTPDSQKNNNSV